MPSGLEKSILPAEVKCKPTKEELETIVIDGLEEVFTKLAIFKSKYKTTKSSWETSSNRLRGNRNATKRFP